MTEYLTSIESTDGNEDAMEATENGVRIRLLTALAKTRAQTLEDLLTEIGGPDVDIEINSKEAEVIISMLEAEEERNLAQVSDLEPEQLCTLSALTSLLTLRMAS